MLLEMAIAYSLSRMLSAAARLGIADESVRAVVIGLQSVAESI
jgi:hypothetical protein